MEEVRSPVRMRPAPLFWRVFGLNALVFVAGVGAVAVSPRSFSRPLQPVEALDLGVGLLLMLAMNAVLLRVGLAPLDRLAGMMETVDLLHPGQRLRERDAGDLAPLARSFNSMLERLEAERATSSARTQSAQEEERRRIARELHDEVGQGLTALLLELSQLSDDVPRTLRPTTRRLLERARESLSDVGRIAQRLRPDVLDELGLPAALSALLSDFTDLTGVPVRRHMAAPRHLSHHVELVLYRVAQESITNIARHADARSVDFGLELCDHQGLRMTVKDDGRGTCAPEGDGIRGMRERALHVHGNLEITSRPGWGTELTLVVPLDEDVRGDS